MQAPKPSHAAVLLKQTVALGAPHALPAAAYDFWQLGFVPQNPEGQATVPNEQLVLVAARWTHSPTSLQVPLTTMQLVSDADLQEVPSAAYS